MAGPFSISDANGSRTLDLLSVAPPADTGQVAVPVRVISQLGATAGGSSAGLTDAQLRASPVPVSGFPATQPVSGLVAVSNLPATQPVIQRAADLAISVTGAAAAAVTATLPAVAGQFHYISRINIIQYNTAARTGVAAPVVVTSTNLPGPLNWTTPTAGAIGAQYETDIQLTSPLKSSAANVNTTIAAPATASVIWRINVIYYTGP